MPPDSADDAPLQWLDDGTPYSPRFEDRYHSSQNGGLSQSRGSFLQGCGLPAAWRGQPQWRVLETGFGLGLNFLATWQAWRDDPERSERLHFVSTEAWPVNAEAIRTAATQGYPSLLPLAEQLAAEYDGIHTGLHRFSFEGGRVHLTLAIGAARDWLRSEGWQADSVYLDGFDPAKNPDIWSLDTLKAVARCCLPGHTRLASWCVARSVRDALAQCGFAVERVAGTPPKRHNLRALYAPAWQRKTRADSHPLALRTLPSALRQRAGRHCAVIGAGIAGASVARAMAERGWQVTVLERADAPAQGASALPVGLFAPHISPDDAPLSRLTRAGVRCTRQTAAQLLQMDRDWQPSGVLEHRVGKKLGLPASASVQRGTASRPATAKELVQAGVVAADASGSSTPPAVLHRLAGWLRPAALVQALLAHPGIQVRPRSAVQSLAPVEPTSGCTGWQLLDAAGQRLAQADCVVIAAAWDSLALAQPWASVPLPLHAVRGQVAWGVHQPTEEAAPLPWPPLPVNGKGSLVHVAQCDTTSLAAAPSRLWISGGTFERNAPLLPADATAVAQAMQENRRRLPLLLPAAGAALAQSLFDDTHQPARHWGAVRCTVPDRTPLYGPLDPARPTLLLATGLGSRGLTLACLAAQTLAAALHDEPLPLSRELARLLDTGRLLTAH